MLVPKFGGCRKMDSSISLKISVTRPGAPASIPLTRAPRIPAGPARLSCLPPTARAQRVGHRRCAPRASRLVDCSNAYPRSAVSATVRMGRVPDRPPPRSAPCGPRGILTLCCPAAVAPEPLHFMVLWSSKLFLGQLGKKYGTLLSLRRTAASVDRLIRWSELCRVD